MFTHPLIYVKATKVSTQLKSHDSKVNKKCHDCQKKKYRSLLHQMMHPRKGTPHSAKW